MVMNVLKVCINGNGLIIMSNQLNNTQIDDLISLLEKQLRPNTPQFKRLKRLNDIRFKPLCPKCNKSYMSKAGRTRQLNGIYQRYECKDKNCRTSKIGEKIN